MELAFQWGKSIDDKKESRGKREETNYSWSQRETEKKNAQLFDNSMIIFNNSQFIELNV